MIPTDEPSLLSLLLCVSTAVTVLDDTAGVDVTDVTMRAPMEVTNIDVVVVSSSAVRIAPLLNIVKETGMIVAVSVIGAVEIVSRITFIQQKSE